MKFESNLDPYLLIFTFVLGAASAYFYIQSLPSSRQNGQISSVSNGKMEQVNGNMDRSGSGSGVSQEQGKKKVVRIYVDGCWDLCHSGHYNAIRQAKSLGDHLVVGVHSSEEIARNKRWPIMTDQERTACVDSCKWVDQVVFDVPYSPSIELLDRSDVSADYCAHGDDIAIAANGKSAYADVQSRLKIFKRTPGVSTTNLIDRLLCALNYEESTAVTRNKNNCEDENGDDKKKKNNSKKGKNETESENGNKLVPVGSSWSQFLSSSHRIAAFSNNTTPHKDDKVVYIDGIFDLFHAGHIAAIKEAKKQGTFLYVGLFDDTIVRKQKGPYFPLMNIQERTLNVLSCKFVDEVIIACPWEISSDMIQVLNIDTVVTTHITNELSDDNDARYQLARDQGMLKHVIPKDSELTTTGLMKRIAKDQQRMKKENENRVQKEMAYLQTRQYIEEA